MAVVLASLLVFTGLGAHLSGRYGHVAAIFGPGRPPLWAALVSLIWIWVVPAVFDATLGTSIAARIAIAVCLLAPVGLALGAPFPTGLSVVGRRAAEWVAWAFGINAFFTVLGTVLAQIVGMALGFSFVSLVACVCYGVAAILGPSLPGARDPS
jgi:hypothetical protein